MSLKLIKDLEDKIVSLSTQVDSLTETSRKGKVPEVTTISRDEASKYAKRASSLHLLTRLTGKSEDSFEMFADVKEYAKRAMLPTSTPEWLAEEFSKDLYERMTLLANVESFFRKYTVSPNFETLSVPEKTSKAVAYLIAPAQTAIESAITSAKVTFKVKRLFTLVTMADQANDETVIALIDTIKQDIVESLVIAMENALINGDTDATPANLNGAVVGASATDQLKVFDGLRKITVTNTNTVDFGATLTYNGIVAMRNLMGKDGINQADLVYIVSPSTYFKMLAFPELQTQDKYGSQATVFRGEVAKVGAIPVVVSEFVPTNLNATGVYDAAGDKTTILLVNKKYFGVADRNTLGFEEDRTITSSVNIYVGHRDVDFKPLLSDKEISVLAYNVPTV